MPVPPQVNLDRIAFGNDTPVEGQVVRSDRAPKVGAKVVFVAAGQGGAQQEVVTNTAGRFQVNLASGNWLVYLTGPDGRQAFHSRIEVGDNPSGLITLMSR